VSQLRINYLTFCRDTCRSSPTSVRPTKSGEASTSSASGIAHFAKNYPVSDNLLALAKTTMQVNLAVDRRDVDDSSQAEILTVLA
jgi:hypothetical protein